MNNQNLVWKTVFFSLVMTSFLLGGPLSPPQAVAEGVVYYADLNGDAPGYGDPEDDEGMGKRWDNFKDRGHAVFTTDPAGTSDTFKWDNRPDGNPDTLIFSAGDSGPDTYGLSSHRQTVRVKKAIRIENGTDVSFRYRGSGRTDIYTPEIFVKEGTQLTVKGVRIHLDHPDEEGTLVKTGGGTLRVRRSNITNDVRVEEGAIRPISPSSYGHEEMNAVVPWDGSQGPAPVRISSLGELAEYAKKSDNHVKMEPGYYDAADFFKTVDDGDPWQFTNISGSGNRFDLRGVTIRFDTARLSKIQPAAAGFNLTGSNNELQGLNVIYSSDSTYGSRACSIRGDGNTLRDCSFVVRGSFPYGYGSLLGIGGDAAVPLKKRGGVLIHGDSTRLVGVDVYMRAFGHAIFFEGAKHLLFRDCYVEGQMRSTDEMLNEPGYLSDTLRQRGHKPGRMESLSEDAFRSYGNVRNVRIVNSTVKGMRRGTAVSWVKGKITIKNSTFLGNRRGSWYPANNTEFLNVRADARFGPILKLNEGSRHITARINVLPAKSEFNSILAQIKGNDHDIHLKPSDGEQLRGYVIGLSNANGVELINETGLPIKIEKGTSNCTIRTNGKVIGDGGSNNEITDF